MDSRHIKEKFPGPLTGFREKTLEAYKEGHPEDREGWRALVMRIHEESDFLFYFDDSLEMDPKSATMQILGEHVKGKLPLGSKLYLYTGQGEYLGSGRMMTDPEEKEQGRKGLLARRRNEFLLELTGMKEVPVSGMDETRLRQCFQRLLMDLSLISDKDFKKKD